MTCPRCYTVNPAVSRRSGLEMPEQFVELIAAGYFFMRSLSALRIVLT